METVEGIAKALEGSRGATYSRNVRALTVPENPQQGILAGERIIPRTKDLRFLSVKYGNSNGRGVAAVLDASIALGPALTSLSLYIEERHWSPPGGDKAFLALLSRALRSFVNLSALRFEVFWYDKAMIDTLEESLPFGSIRFLDFTCFLNAPFGDRLLQKLGEQNQIEWLRIHTDRETTIGKVAPAIATPGLEHLSFKFTRFAGSSEDQSWPDRLVFTGNLRSLDIELEGILEPVNSLVFPAPFGSQIHVIPCHGELGRLFERCPDLESLKLTGYPVDNEFPLLLSNTLNPGLRKLTLGMFRAPGDVSLALSRCKNLQSLSISFFMVSPSQTDWDVMASYPALSSFGIILNQDWKNSDLHSLEDVLKKLPSLGTLTFAEDEIPTKWLARLQAAVPSGCYIEFADLEGETEEEDEEEGDGGSEKSWFTTDEENEELEIASVD